MSNCNLYFGFLKYTKAYLLFKEQQMNYSWRCQLHWSQWLIKYIWRPA